MSIINELCQLVRQTAYAIHVYHGHGHLEKVYENALAYRSDTRLSQISAKRARMNFGATNFRFRKYAMSSRPRAI